MGPEIAALIVSGVAVVVSLIGVGVSVVGLVWQDRRASEATRVALEALRQSKDTDSIAYWNGAQEAVQHLVGFDPASEPVNDRLVNLRVALIALVDHLDGWDGLDHWLEVERVLGATLARETMERARPGDDADARLDALGLLLGWANALSKNLRRFRIAGYDVAAVEMLRANAEQLVSEVCERNGWPVPSSLANQD